MTTTAEPDEAIAAQDIRRTEPRACEGRRSRRLSSDSTSAPAPWRFADEITAAAMVFWNGPMGRVELERSAAGTRTIADAVAATAATTVVGGGETVAAMRSFGLADQVSHL